MHSVIDLSTGQVSLDFLKNWFENEDDSSQIDKAKKGSIHYFFITKKELLSSLNEFSCVLSFVSSNSNISYRQFCEIQSKSPVFIQRFLNAESYFSLTKRNPHFRAQDLYEYASKKAWINLLRTYLVLCASAKPYLEEKDLPSLCEQLSECPYGYWNLVAANFIIELGNPPWRLSKVLIHPVLVTWSSFSSTFSYSYFRTIRDQFEQWIDKETERFPFAPFHEYFSKTYTTYFLEEIYRQFKPFSFLHFLQCYLTMHSLSKQAHLKFLYRLLDIDGYGVLTFTQIQEYLRHAINLPSSVVDDSTFKDISVKIFDMLQWSDEKPLPLSILLKSDLAEYIFKILTHRDFYVQHESSIN